MVTSFHQIDFVIDASHVSQDFPDVARRRDSFLIDELQSDALGVVVVPRIEDRRKYTLAHLPHDVVLGRRVLEKRNFCLRQPQTSVLFGRLLRRRLRKSIRPPMSASRLRLRRRRRLLRKWCWWLLLRRLRIPGGVLTRRRIFSLPRLPLTHRRRRDVLLRLLRLRLEGCRRRRRQKLMVRRNVMGLPLASRREDLLLPFLRTQRREPPSLLGTQDPVLLELTRHCGPRHPDAAGHNDSK